MNRLSTLLVAVFLVCSSQIKSQEIQLSDVSFLDADNVALLHPFIGGLRAPQFSTADLNLDGLDDVVIFDRDGSIVTPLIRRADGSLEFSPSYRDLFPDIRDWMLLRDFNQDGIKDIFCSPVEIAIPGIAVYRGVITDGVLSYELVRFPEQDFDILTVPIGRATPQIFASIVDLPDIRDLDGDGDLDILSFEPTGFTIHHFRNMAVERDLGIDSLEFVLEETCYGGMLESGFSEEVTLSTNIGVCAEFTIPPDELVAKARHAGSTIASIDLNGDGLQEVLLGDVSYNGLVALTNGGTREEAFFVEQDARFPGIDNDPVMIELFVTAFHEDIDGDGEKELLSMPSDIFSSQSIDHSWLYDIDQSGGEFSYNLVSKNFLIEDMVLAGTNSSPEFWDFNNDGLVDILVGSSGTSSMLGGNNPALLLYQNVGDITNPVYELIDDDFGDMRQFRTTSLNFDPTVGDLDGDGDDDVIVGDNGGLLYYLENLSGQKGIVDLAPASFRTWNIKVSAWASPEIYDYNKDGLGDLIIGELNFNSVDGARGSFNYFENIGSEGNPDFNPDEFEAPNNPIFGRIDLKDPGSFNNFSAADIVISEDDFTLVTGTSLGDISVYQTSDEAPQDSFDLVSQSYGDLYEGRQSKVSLADIDDDKYYEIAIGNRRGGLAIYDTDLKVATNTPTIDIATSSEVDIWPNPARDILRVRSNLDFLQDADFRIIDMAGRVVSQGRLLDGSIDISTLQSNIYLLEIQEGQDRYIQKIVKVDP